MAKATFVVAWRQPEDIWQQLPHVEVVCSLGAGVDGLINDVNLPKSASLIRIVDKNLSGQMADFVQSILLMKNIRLDKYINQQHQSKWQPQERHDYKNVAILGVGQIGQAVGQKLHDNGFNVTGWNRNSKPELSFNVRTGMKALPDVLAGADFIVSILPATNATQHLINKQLFKCMASHACFINVGRGSTVNEDDLLLALDNHEIASAVLDVVQLEPLPTHSPLWSHPQVILTPHIAAITDQKQVVRQIVDNYLAHNNQQPLSNTIDRKLGY